MATVPVIPLLLIVGPTASGKSTLGIEVAEALDGEIVSADAFAVYRGLDIGTDKPSPEDRRRVRHHMIDVVDPRVRYSAGEFSVAATAAIEGAIERGRTPIVVGGTLFYVRALLYGLFPAPPRDAALKRRLQAEWNRDPSSVRQRLAEVDPEALAVIGTNDRQRILRALGHFEQTGTRISQSRSKSLKHSEFRPLLAVPQRSRNALYDRIDSRVDSMFSCGLVKEVEQLLGAGIPPDAHAFKAIGYQQVLQLISGRQTLATAVSETKRTSRALAKRQITGLRKFRNAPVHLVAPAEDNGAENVIARWNDHVKGRGLT